MQPRRTRPRPPRFARHLVALIVAGCAVLAVPALAQANSTLSYDGAFLTYDGEDAVNNVATVSLNASATTYTITDSENITTASGGCTGSGTQTVTCTAATPGNDDLELNGLDGNDTLTVDTSAAAASDQPQFAGTGSNAPDLGNDHIDLSKYTNPSGNSRIVGGPGDDVETAATAGTEFYMGSAPDGADELIGGPGFDEANYDDRSGNLTMNAADGLANDGEPGELDNISSNIDELPGGSGNDNIQAGSVDSELFGGDGNDTVAGGPGNDEIGGGSGTNTLTGGPGDDSLGNDDGSTDTMDGGPGDDEFELENGSADVHGGDGFDFVGIFEEGPPPDFALLNVSVTLDDLANDGASGDFTNVHSDVEDIETSGGDDTIVGSNAPEEIFTGLGNDAVNDGGGSDQVFTGPGDDAVSARDGIFDRISCGSGTDSATVDDIDALSGCENVSSLAVPPIQPARDTQRAKVAISGLAKKLARKKFLKSGLSLRVTPNEPARFIFTLTGHAHGARISRSGDLVVATKSLGQSGARRTVRLKPSKKLHFARHFKLRLEVLAVDGGGNLTKVNRTIAVK